MASFDELIRLGWDGSAFRQGITADVNYAIREFERLASAAAQQGSTAKIPVLPPAAGRLGYEPDLSPRQNAADFARLAALQQQQLRVAARTTGQTLPGGFTDTFRQQSLREAQGRVPNFGTMSPGEKGQFTREFNRVFGEKVSEFSQIFDGITDVGQLKSRFSRVANQELASLGINDRVQTVTPQAAVAAVGDQRGEIQNQEKARLRRERDEREVQNLRQQLVNAGREDEIGGATAAEKQRAKQTRQAIADRQKREAEFLQQSQRAGRGPAQGFMAGYESIDIDSASAEADKRIAQETRARNKEIRENQKEINKRRKDEATQSAKAAKAAKGRKAQGFLGDIDVYGGFDKQLDKVDRDAARQADRERVKREKDAAKAQAKADEDARRRKATATPEARASYTDQLVGDVLGDPSVIQEGGIVAAVKSFVKALVTIEANLTKEMAGFTTAIAQARVSTQKLNASIDAQAKRALVGDKGYLQDRASSRVSGAEINTGTDRTIGRDADLRRRQSAADAERAALAEQRRRDRDRVNVDRGRLDLIPKSRRADLGLTTATGAIPAEKQVAALQTQAKALKASLADVKVIANPEEARRVITSLSAQFRSLIALAESGIDIDADDGILRAKLAKIRQDLLQLKGETVSTFQAVRSGTTPGLGGPNGPSGPSGPVVGGAGGGPSGGGKQSFYDRVRGSGGLTGFFGGGALSSIRYGLPSALLFGAATGISQTIKQAEEFNVVLSQIEAQFDATFGADAQTNFTQFRQSILDISKETGLAVDEVASLGQQIVGAFDGQKIEGLSGLDLSTAQTESASKLAQVTKLPLAEITDGLTAASLAFGASFETIGDVSIGIQQETGVLAKETIGFIGDIAPVAKEAGFTLEEFASIAAIAQQRSGRSGATLAEQFGRIIPAVSEAKDELFQLAQSESSLQTPEFINAIQTSNIAGILKILGQEFVNLNQESKQFVINLLGGRREAGAILPALGNPEALKAIEAAADDSSGLLEERFKKISETITVTLQRASEQLKQLGIALLNSGLSDLFVDIVNIAGKFIGVLTKLIELASSLNDAFGGWPVKILASVAAFRLLSTGLGRIPGLGGPGVSLGARGQALGQRISGIPGAIGGLLPQSVRALPGAVGGSPIRDFRTAYSTARAPSITTFGGPDPRQRLAGPGGGFGQGLGFGLSQTTSGASRLQALKAGGGAALGGLRGGSALLAAVGGLPGLAITGAIAGYTLFQSKLSDDANKIKELQEYARDANTSVKELERKARDLAREDAGPGNATSIKTFFTRGANLSEQQIAEAELILKKVNAERLAIYKAAGDLDGVVQRELRNSGSVKVPGKSSGAVGEEIKKSFEKVADPNQTLGTSGLLEDLQESADAGSDIASGQLKFYTSLADEIGVKVEDLTRQVIKDYISKNPVSELIKTLNAREGVDAETRQQAINALEALVNLGLADPSIANQLNDDSDVKNLKVEAKKETLETIEKNFKSGRIDFNTYIEARSRNIAELRKTIELGDYPNAEELQNIIAEEKDLRETISAQAVASLDVQLETIDLAGGRTQEDVLRQKIAATQAALSSGKITGSDARQAAKNLIGFQRDLQETLIDGATNASEAAAIASEGFDISVATRLQLIIGASVEALVVNWDRVNAGFVTIFGTTADAMITFLITALETGQLSLEQVKFIVGAQVVKLREQLAIAQYYAGAAGQDNQAIKDIQQALSVAESQLANLNSTGTFLGDTGSKGNVEDPEKAKDKAKEDAKKLVDAKASLAKARAKGNAVAVALIDLQAARQNFYDTLADPEATEADRISALAGVVSAEDAVQQSVKRRADAVRSVGAAFARGVGDSVLAATKDLEQANADLAEASRRDDAEAYAQAQIAIINSTLALRDAIRARAEAFMNLVTSSRGDNPLDQAQNELQQAQRQVAEALGIDQQIEAQQRLVDAQKALTSVMQEIRYSQYNLRQAELEAMDEDAAAAAVGAQLARQQLADAIARNAGGAEINNLRAGVVRAERSARDALFEERYDDYKFLFDMGQITKSEYVNYLEGLKSTIAPGTKQFRELELAIKQLNDDISGDLQMNLPTSLTLPTLYEVRRLDQTGGQAGSATTAGGIGYQDNRNMNVNITVANGMSAGEVLDVVSDAIGPGRTGFDARAY